MNGEHLASSRCETGDINLNKERSNNIDLTFNFDYQNWFGSASVYYNRVDNYIYLRDELEVELTLGRDEVNAESSNGEDVKRIVPARNMLTALHAR